MARRYPRYESDPYTPAQGARLLDQFFAGLARRRGRLQRVVQLAALVAVLAICALLVADAIRIFR